jgi:nucleoside-diphosphate-sugar epimerase
MTEHALVAPETPRTILITGAAGNLGSRLGRHLLDSPHHVRLMVHRSPLPGDLQAAPGVEVVRADLGEPESLRPAVRGADTVVHFAGVLFGPRPERFLPVTNTVWFGNLLDACIAERVDRVVLISFPHVEGPTTPKHPATGRLDRNPISVHARTRLEEERLLMTRTDRTATTPVSLRLGMVYGRGILMIEGARWLARHRLLGVWREPTWIHVVSTDDFLAVTTAAATRPGVQGIYHAGDDHPLTLQEFLDEACKIWDVRRPWRMPLWMIRLAAGLCELGARGLRKPSPLTRDFIEIGRVSYTGDTRRMHSELLAALKYPSFEEGKNTLA